MDCVLLYCLLLIWKRVFPTAPLLLIPRPWKAPSKGCKYNLRIGYYSYKVIEGGSKEGLKGSSERNINIL